MKLHRVFLCLIALAATLGGTAHARSPAQAYYADCLSVARYERELCRHGHYRHGNCGRAYQRDKDRCSRNFTRMVQHNPYLLQRDHFPRHPHYAGPPQRFGPTPVPRRPKYHLHGMR